MQTFYTSDRAVWRNWLAENFETQTEIWFVFPTPQSGEARLPYNDAVEEALCFGWIDGRAGKTDATHEVRRFTPRRTGSGYSQSNIERLLWLDSMGMLHPKIREQVRPILEKPFHYPQDILEAIQKDETAWAHFNRFSEPYKRIRIDYIEQARKEPEQFEKRLQSFIRKTRENKIIMGFGGSEKYYK